MSENVPERRFPEFNGKWEENNLGDILEIINSKYNPENGEGNFKCVELEHISQNTGLLIGYCNSDEQNSIKNRFEKGNVLFGKLRPYLKKYWLAEFDGVCSSEIWVFNGKKVQNSFLFQFIQTEKFNYISNISSGSKMPRSDWSYMKEVKFKTPSQNEQTKIASFLSKVDEKIEKLEEKQQLWETYKKGIMQQIFNQKLRFKDEKGEDYPDWENKKLGEVGKTYNGLQGKNKENFGQGQPYITYKSIFDSRKIDLEKVDLVKISQGEKQKKVKYGDIFFTTSSETPEEVGMASALLNEVKECYLNSFCFGFRLNSFEKTSPEFMSFYLRSQNLRAEIKKLAQGSTRYNISKTEMMKLDMKIPSLPEQSKIANFLTNIEKKIEELNKELKLNREFKKGLLQRMFC